MRMRLLALLLLPIAGCASKSDTQVADTATPVCVREYRVGSNIPSYNCSAPKTEAQREQMLEDIRNNMGPSRPPAAGGGGG